MKTTVIDGKQYREVSRKASVGDLVLFKNADATFGDYENGDVWTVGRRDPSGVYKTKGELWPYADDSEYVVLEPLATEEKSADIRALVDGLTETVASLTLRVTELERKAAPPKPLTVKIDGSSIAEKLLEAFALSKRKPRTRDEIVDQAKKDVAELTRRASEDSSHGHEFPAVAKCGRLTFKFVVNRDKRTVAAIGSLRYVIGSVHARGKARCAPDDCFNAHIGRAIALRRALGLTVPSEYYEAPQPTEVRVGDIVEWDRRTGNTYVITEGMRVIGLFDGDDYTDFANMNKAIVIDDSREEVSE